MPVNLLRLPIERVWGNCRRALWAMIRAARKPKLTLFSLLLVRSNLLTETVSIVK